VITVIVGNLGSGKTLLLALMGILGLEENKQVYTTFHLTYKTSNGKEARYVDVGDLMQWFEDQDTSNIKEHSALLCVDEGYLGMDSRTSGSISNRLLMQFVLQSRHLGLDLKITAQLASSIDKRVRLNTDEFILAEKIKRSVIDFSGTVIDVVDDFRYTSSNGKTFYFTHVQAEQIFPYYSTMEIVPPPEISLDKKTASKMKARITRKALDKRRKEKRLIDRTLKKKHTKRKH
jgi:predicted ATPase